MKPSTVKIQDSTGTEAANFACLRMTHRQTRRAPRPDQKQFTTALTAQIEALERDLDARVAALYGL
jgi:hypothetical protein